jgi:ABC-2 type transport system permease protein
MTGQLRSELFKQRTTRTNLGLLLAMVALIAVVVLLHVVALPTQGLTGRQDQLKVVGLGTTFGMIFGSLIGALSITNEIRHGMIRPTFLAMPHRSRVIATKVVASLIAGVVLGLLAEAIAIGVGSAGLAVRGIGIAPSVGDCRSCSSVEQLRPHSGRRLGSGLARLSAVRLARPSAWWCGCCSLR